MPLPEGVQIISGVVRPAKLSLVRRGTHILYQDTLQHVYLESTIVNLAQHENSLVSLSGIYEMNSDSNSLPVFVVESILESEDTTKEWKLSILDVTVKTPVDWERHQSFGGVHFTASGSSQAVVSLSREPLEEEVPSGESIAISGKPAFRQIDEALGVQTVFVLLENDMLVLTFNPNKSVNEEILRIQWTKLLSTLSFSLQSSSSVISGSGSSGNGAPCGGPAGLLCPTGEYCEVTDFKEDIGSCKKI
ncbi:MAG: hypothetical protein KAS32_21885 [Candidatus Peribacteraceae bacterium]|nr:hypothetical protein [Candidatus Peribacteraceae bacterium]